jgi:hypothetical protein
MANAVYYSAASRTAASKDKADPKKDDARTGLFVVLFIVILSVLMLLFQLVFVPMFRVENVIISGFQGIDESEVLKAAGLDGGAYFFLIDAKEIEANIKAVYPVSSVIIGKKFPDTLTIEAVIRSPLGIVLVEDAGKTIPAVFDKEGVVFERAGASSMMPVLTGVAFPSYVLGMKIPEALSGLLASLAALKADDPAVYEAISEVEIVRLQDDEYELLVYCSQWPVKMRLSKNLDGYIMKNAFVILEVLESQGGLEKIREIDFRTGQIVYSVKEDDSGRE